MFDPARLTKTYSRARLALMAALQKGDRTYRLAFLRTIKNIRDVWTLDYLTRAIANGDTERALRIAQVAAANLAAANAAVFTVGADQAAGTLESGLRVNLSFDRVNQRSVDAMRAQSLRLIREFTEDQRGMVRIALTEGIRTGAHHEATARMIRGGIGLTARQQAAVVNYRRLLTTNNSQALERALRDRRFDSTVARAIREDRQLSPVQIDRMVERYQARYLQRRGEDIARTESIRSVHEGSAEMFQQAIDDGVVDRERITRTWNTVHDKAVRDSHAEMDGQVVAWDEPFTSGNGFQLMYPGDPAAPAEETINCRCEAVIRIERETQQENAS